MMYSAFGILMLIVLFYVLLAIGIFAVLLKHSFFSDSGSPAQVRVSEPRQNRNSRS